MGQGEFLRHSGHRGPVQAPVHPPMRPFQGRGSLMPSALHPRPAYSNPGPGIGGPARFRGSNPTGGHRPAFQRGFPYTRGRGRGFRDGQNQHEVTSRTSNRDPFGKI